MVNDDVVAAIRALVPFQVGRLKLAVVGLCVLNEDDFACPGRVNRLPKTVAMALVKSLVQMLIGWVYSSKA